MLGTSWNEHELGQTSGDGEGQEGLACCSPWGRKESDMTERLNNNNKVEKINDSLNYQRKAEIKSRYADY